MNKIVKKAYIELPDYDESVPDEEIANAFWDAHIKRNDSIVVDLFQGQYRSQITCKKCSKVIYNMHVLNITHFDVDFN